MRNVRYCIRDIPTILFTRGDVMSEIPQTERDKEFAKKDLLKGVEEVIYEVLSEGEVESLVR